VHRFLIIGIMPTLFFAGAAMAQQSNSYLRDAELHRAGNIVTIVANDPRPLEQALQAVLQEYGWTIDYEDPPYQSSLELVDVTAPGWKAAHPSGPRALNIRGGEFRTSYSEPAVQAKVIRQIVADYNSSGNPGQFEVRERADGRLQVVGIGVKDDSGSQQRVPSLLDEQVLVPAGSMNLHEAVAAILTALNARSDVKVGGDVPSNMGFQTMVKLSGSEMSARDALREVLSQAKLGTYWLLNYDAGMKTYILNIELATRAEYDAAGNRHVQLIR